MLFFFNDTATTEIYTLSLHDALPISSLAGAADLPHPAAGADVGVAGTGLAGDADRSEEHTSELQSQSNLVCRLLLEKKKVMRSPRSCNDIRGVKARNCSTWDAARVDT